MLKDQQKYKFIVVKRRDVEGLLQNLPFGLGHSQAKVNMCVGELKIEVTLVNRTSKYKLCKNFFSSS